MDWDTDTLMKRECQCARAASRRRGHPLSTARPRHWPEGHARAAERKSTAGPDPGGTFELAVRPFPLILAALTGGYSTVTHSVS